MHSAFNLFVFPNSMFTPLLLFFIYERAMSSPEKLHLKITIIITGYTHYRLLGIHIVGSTLGCITMMCPWARLFICIASVYSADKTLPDRKTLVLLSAIRSLEITALKNQHFFQRCSFTDELQMSAQVKMRDFLFCLA